MEDDRNRVTSGPFLNSLLVYCFMGFAVLSCSVMAETDWTGGVVNNLWSNTANWTAGVPGSADDVEIWETGIYTPNEGPVIDSTAACAKFKFRNGQVNIVSGGSLTIYNWGDIGSWQSTEPAFPGIGVMTISGTGILSMATENSNRFYVGNFTDGLLIMKDDAQFNVNAILQAGTQGAVGHIQLDGGQITCNNFALTNGSTMDITDGTLIVYSDIQSLLGTYKESGLMTAFGGEGQFIVDYTASPEMTTVTASIEVAWNPKPANTSEQISRHTVLSWSPGQNAEKHDVYFSIDFDQVDIANDPNTLPGRGRYNVDSNSYDLGALELAQTYYWRIDEVTGSGVVKGNIWSFKVTNILDADFNFDKTVNYLDYAKFARAWSSTLGQPDFNSIFDINKDNNINTVDLNFFAKDWLQLPLADLTVNVTSSTITGQMSELLLGIGMSYWRDTDAQWADGTIAGLLADINTPLMRFPGGTEVDTYHWSECPGSPQWKDSWETNPNSDLYFSDPDGSICAGTEYMDIDEFLYWCYDVIGAEAAIGVNFESGWRFNRFSDSLAEAISLVQHCKNLGYNVKYWYIGNEAFFLPGYQPNTGVYYTYADIIDMFSAAMKQVDPTIQIMGNDRECEFGESSVWNEWQATIQNSSHINIADFHMQWARLHTTWDKWLNQNPLLNEFHSYVGPTYVDEFENWRQNMSSTVKLAAMEWGAGVPDTSTWEEDTLSAYQCSMVQSEMLMQFIEGGLHMAALYPGTFSVLATRNPGRGLIDPATKEPWPTYEVFKMFSNGSGQHVVDCNSSGIKAPSLAMLSQDGQHLWVYLLNKNGANKVANVNITGNQISSCQAVSLISDNIYTDEYTLVNPDVSALNGTLRLTLPGYSLTMLTVDF